jgi:hypothetical protein
MAPLSVFPIKTAYAVWSLGWLVVNCFLLNLNLKTGAIKGRLDRALFICSTMASAPAIIGVKLGQTSPWFYACLCLMWYGWRARRDALGALGFAVSTVKLQYSFLLAIPIFLRGRKKFLGWSAVFGAAILLVTVLDVGWRNFLIYPAWLRFVESTGATGVSPESMINFYGIVLHFLPRQTSLLLSVALFAAATFYTCTVWWRSRSLNPDQDNRDGWPIAVTLCLALVTGLHVHYHDCIMLSLAAAFTLKHIGLRASAADADPWYRIWSTTLLYYPFVSWICYMYRDEAAVPILGLVNIALAASAIIQFERAVKGEGKVQYATS